MFQYGEMLTRSRQHNGRREYARTNGYAPASRVLPTHDRLSTVPNYPPNKMFGRRGPIAAKVYTREARGLRQTRFITLGRPSDGGHYELAGLKTSATTRGLRHSQV